MSSNNITEKEENIRKIAELYQNMDDIHRGMLLGWAAALKMMANDDDK